jgi:GntR family transcriptional regulator
VGLVATDTPPSADRPYRISRSTKLPLYHQIEVDLRERIRSGEWHPADLVPPEARLCELYRASRITVRRALANMVASGLLERVPGKGTYVREPGIAAGARGLTSFTEELEAFGLRPSTRLLQLSKELPGPEVAGKLMISPEEPILVVSRLRLGDGRPLGLQTSHLVGHRFPGLEEADLESGSLYTYLGRVYGTFPEEADEVFRVVPIRGQAARYLEVRAGSCGFHVERVTRDKEGAYEYVVSILRADRYEVRLRLMAEAR